MNKVETRIMATETRVNRAVSCKGITGTVTKERGIIKGLGTLASRHLKITTLPT